MKIKILVILCMIFISISFTSCWNRRELKTLAIVDSVIYDIDDEKNVDLVLEILKPSASGGGEQSGGGKKEDFIIAKGKGKSASEALFNVTNTFDLKLYYANNIVRFYTEKFARQSIIPSMDFIFRDHEMRQSAYMIIIKGEGKENLFSASLGMSDTIGQYFANLYLAQNNTVSKAVFVETLEFMRDYYEDGKQPVAGVVEIIKTKKQESADSKESSKDGSSGSSEDVEYKLKCDGLAAFKDNKLVGFMDGIEARSYNLITNHLKTAFITIPFEDGDTSVEILKSKTEIKTNLKNKQPVFDVTIKVNLVIAQESGSKDVSQDVVLKKIEEKVNKLLEKEIKSTLDKVQKEFKSDIFGFGLFAHPQNPDEFRKIKLKWDDTFCKATINVKVDSTIDKIGELKEPINMEENK